MGLIAKSENNSKPIPPDIYQAVCIAVVDLGTHKNDTFNKLYHKVLIMWEIPELRLELEKEDGTELNLPRCISKKYTLSLFDQSNLSKDLVSWRGKPFTGEEKQGFDITVLANLNCNLQIVNEPARDGSGKMYSNIASITKLKKTETPLKAEREVIVYTIDDNGFDGIPENLPDWIKDEIKKSVEYQCWLDGQSISDDPPEVVDQEPDNTSPTDPYEDDIPF